MKEQELISHSTYYAFLHEDDCELKDRMDDPIAFNASKEQDEMHNHEAMRASDLVEFINYMIKEA